MWNEKMINIFSRQQKSLAYSALDLLREDGEMIYSTCTHAPEENEEVVQFLLDNFDIKIEKASLPKELKTRPGLKEWNGKKFDEQIKNCIRIYPQDNNTEGFFVCKIKRLSNKLKKETNYEENQENFEEDIE
jgi:16S rRNA C967 or C1407 C5-methylase (RsmB/RsmF family)